MEPYQHTEVGTEQSSERFRADARGMLVIGGGLLMGCVFFGALTLFINGFSKEVYEGAGILSYMGVGMGCIMFVNSFVIPMMIGRKQGGSLDEWIGIFRSKMIVGMSLCEGASFFNLIAYFIDQQLMSLGMVLLLMVRLVSQIPTAGGLESWVTDRMRSVEQGF